MAGLYDFFYLKFYDRICCFFEGIQDSGIYRDDFSYFGGHGGGYADRISAQARQQQDPLDITGGTGAFDTVYDHCL